MQEITIENIEARLKQLNIFELRQTARAAGVECAAAGKKSEVQAKIIAIANGTVEPVPVPPEKRKFCEYADKGLVKDIQAYRKSLDKSA